MNGRTMLNVPLACASLLSLALTLWQWCVARRFPIHQRAGDPQFAPPVTLLKPLKGADAETFACLESWLNQDYSGPVQVLVGVASEEDPACALARRVIAAHPHRDARLIICCECLGANGKVSTMIQLQRAAKHDVLIVSDADVFVPRDFLANVVLPLREPESGLVTCLYRLANPSTTAMQWEAIAMNADFWTQVLQARSLRPLDFALGAVMATTRKRLEAVGGFDALADYLADDYQLGHRIARQGGSVELSPVVVDCRESAKGWREVWAHQLRWARTIRVCKPLPYFCSILGNATLWPLLWFLAELPGMARSFRIAPNDFTGDLTAVSTAVPVALPIALVCLLARMVTALHNHSRLTRGSSHLAFWWLVPLKDLAETIIWALAFLGSGIEWRGRRYRVTRGGRLASLHHAGTE